MFTPKFQVRPDFFFVNDGPNPILGFNLNPPPNINGNLCKSGCEITKTELVKGVEPLGKTTAPRGGGAVAFY